MATLNLTAEQAMARSEEYDEIVTIEGSAEIHETLRDQCSDNVERYVDHEDGYTLTEYWKNDPDSDDGMLWRVHVRDNDPVERTAEQWWAWHDQDSSRWSSETSEAETRCASWVAGESDDGPSA